MDWELLGVLKTAINDEKEAVGAYLDFAMKSNSIEAKDLFINLCRDEPSHVQKLHQRLSELLEEFLKRGKYQPMDIERFLSFGNVAEGEVKSPKELPAEEIAILQMAITNEEASNKYYSEQAEVTLDPILKALYGGLAKEEEYHEMLLRAELDSVKGYGHWFDFREFTLEAPG